MYNLGQSGRARPRRPSLFNVPQKHQLLLLAVRAGSICLSVPIMFFVCVFFFHVAVLQLFQNIFRSCQMHQNYNHYIHSGTVDGSVQRQWSYPCPEGLSRT